ncbi:MAG: transcriptional regulator with XRE-family HTH domain [Clostridium sp.]|jgi:transcriptional regulator with XRE-family HTH domain
MEEFILDTFGERLKSVRLAKKMTQEQTANEITNSTH